MRPLNPYLFISSQKQRKSFDCIGRRYEYSKYVLLFFATFFNPSFLNKIFHIHSLLSFTLLYVVIQFESNNKNHFLQRGNSTQERATHEITFIAQTNIQLKGLYFVPAISTRSFIIQSIGYKMLLPFIQVFFHRNDRIYC